MPQLNDSLAELKLKVLELKVSQRDQQIAKIRSELEAVLCEFPAADDEPKKFRQVKKRLIPALRVVYAVPRTSLDDEAWYFPHKCRLRAVPESNMLFILNDEGLVDYCRPLNLVREISMSEVQM